MEVNKTEIMEERLQKCVTELRVAPTPLSVGEKRGGGGGAERRKGGHGGAWRRNADAGIVTSSL